jgi:tRNA (guanine37-N1)-methyltransferase
MRVSYVSIFPEIFSSFLHSSLIAKGQQHQLLSCDVYDPRNFTHDPHRQVDDTPYWWGAGMVLKAQPIIDAIRACLGEGGEEGSGGSVGSSSSSLRRLVVMVGPSKLEFCQRDAHAWVEYDHVIFVCGRYEWIDERVALWCSQMFGDDFVRVSLGRFICLGGEMPAMCMTEAVVRLLPGFLGDDESWRHESYSIWDAMSVLEHPHYTRPEVVEGYSVPSVLLSGHHAHIAQWRSDMSERLE